MRILLTSVFGPYGVDDEYGRKENVIELLHNQVTREQGIFSIRFHHQSYGLYFLAENIKAPATVLDFPSIDRFVREIKKGYDYIGISFIVPNFVKARRMAELIREHSPNTKIILGGHGTKIPNVENLIQHDYICRGEGVMWLRQLLGEDTDRPIKHPDLVAAFSKHVLGIPLKSDSVVLIPGVGCPNACRFCATSHFFDKKYTPYFDTGKELFDACCQLEAKTSFSEFFVMDENFLKRPERAKELVKLMKENNKLFRFGLFSSAETINQVGVKFLAELGVNFLWMGVESKYEVYEKNRGVDIKSMIRELREHGVCVLASGILFLEQHDKESIWDDIRFIVDMQSDYVQFMGLGPMPGTALYADYDSKGLIRKDLPYEEWHGQHYIWFRHPNFTAEESSETLKAAFKYDYDVQASSLLRMCDTIIRGSKTLAGYDDPWMRKRAQKIRENADYLRPLLTVLRKYAHNEHALKYTDEVMAKYEEILGPMTIKQKALSSAALLYAAGEAGRVARGENVYQPKTFVQNYRTSVYELTAESMKGRMNGSILDVNVNWSQSPMLVELRGTMDRVNTRLLARKVINYLKNEDGEIHLSLDYLVECEHEALQWLISVLKEYQVRVKFVISRCAESVDTAIQRLPAELAALIIRQGLEPA
ncbi:MAG TPA: B12-binding domain-containing radical SAM protein [Candidatus Brocadiia bacterium]|nr:B12-binding domain-containing radical SAM protein [Candidatus Brocadiia bacterium]